MSIPASTPVVVRAALTLSALVLGCCGAVMTSSAGDTGIPDAIWTVPEIGALPNDAHGRLVRHGRDLVTATYVYIGPEVADPAKRFAGNNLACGNCHLDAGTKKFGAPLFGLFGEFPRYSARSGTEISIEDRIPELTVEQAWDVAAYLVLQPRPHKAGLEKDFPDLLEKPVDTPYGPYADGFSVEQHKFGPFGPIRAEVARLKAEQARVKPPR